MPKGLKKDFPWYAKVEDVLIKGQVNLARLTPKTFATFIKLNEGENADPNDYIVLNLTKYNEINVKEA